MLSIDGFLKKNDAEIPDPRRTGGNLFHKLSDIIVISLISIICGCDSFRKIEVFSKEREKFFFYFS
ncbi:MAG: transposase family protein [Desulfovibrio sp.]|nr:transposase family protein [Desulfovibrio sp.]